VLVSRLRVPRTAFGRALGLMFRAPLGTGEGMLIVPCNGIHTCFLRDAIDAIFLDREHRVVLVRERLAPWRVLPFVGGARSVLELPAGSLEGLGLRAGERLLITPPDDPAGGATPPAGVEDGGRPGAGRDGRDDAASASPGSS